MTIEELIGKKRRLEKEIAEKMLEFEKETGMEISDIRYDRIEVRLGMFGAKEIEVKIDVKL